jgi:Zn-dependent peptidase ImmA (M78 family)/transcriptional regulator with XRE-family HTH domain
MIFGERVKQLREMRQLTQFELAAEIPGLTQSQLSRIETDSADADEGVVEILGAVLGVLPSFLAKEPTEDLSTLTPQLRSRSRLTRSAKKGATQWARLVLEEYHRLAASAAPVEPRLQDLSDLSPSEAAQSVRLSLGFSSAEPLPYLILAAERIGVRVLGLPVTLDSLDAFCLWQRADPIIAVLADAPGDRLRFNIAHELGHLVLHRGSTKVDPRKMEMEADTFAAELLTPRAVLVDLLPRNVTLRSLTMVKTQWGVSIKSLIRTAREVNVIDQARAVSLYRQISARGWNKMEPGYVAREKPRAFRKLAEMAYGPGLNTQALARDSGWSEDLLLAVLRQHATAEELPFEIGRASFGNVVSISSRQR